MSNHSERKKKPRVNFCFQCGRKLWGNVHVEKEYMGHKRIFHKACYEQLVVLGGLNDD